MNNETIDGVIDLILDKTVGKVGLFESQRKSLVVEKEDFFDNSKYIVFNVDSTAEKIIPLNHPPLSIMFWELTQAMPFGK